mmetsp:Transcript_3158/g.6040  ORF Transcript_3158/g.6040 Transcript_3158/m.6040 type:complete len:210 (-) Transcript_3158:634-1263(-)
MRFMVEGGGTLTMVRNRMLQRVVHQTIPTMPMMQQIMVQQLMTALPTPHTSKEVRQHETFNGTITGCHPNPLPPNIKSLSPSILTATMLHAITTTLPRGPRRSTWATSRVAAWAVANLREPHNRGGNTRCPNRCGRCWNGAMSSRGSTYLSTAAPLLPVVVAMVTPFRDRTISRPGEDFTRVWPPPSWKNCRKNAVLPVVLQLWSIRHP